MTGKLLLKLDAVKFIVANHTVIRALDLSLFYSIFTSYVTVYGISLHTGYNDSFLVRLISAGALSLFRRI